MNHSNRRKRSNRSKRRSESSVSSDSFEKVDDGPVFEIKTSQVMGRYIVSRKHLKPGEVILSEEPLVVGPCAGCRVQCLGCYRTLESSTPYIKCKCGWPLCSAKCPGVGAKHGHAPSECHALATSHSSQSLPYNELEKMRGSFEAIVPLRCLLLKEQDPQAWGMLMTMETHNEIRRNIPDLWKNDETIIDRILGEWGLCQYSPEEIHSICGILEVNSFEVGHGGVSLRGLYPSAFLLSHDCVPNTSHADDQGSFRLTVRASTPIKEGERITLSYAHTLQSTLKRRQHLLENKFFECRCGRCSDPGELGTNLGALVCPKCRGAVLPLSPLEAESEWKCTNRAKCGGFTTSARSAERLVEKIGGEVEGIDCNDVEGMEAFLHKYRNVLHPTHYLCLGVKLSLSQLYGRIVGYLIDELSEELLLRKLRICEEILVVFDVLEPGLTRLRGVTLYEMHAPLMILLTRQFEKRGSKSEVRGRLKRVVRCLEEAALILGFEPKGTAEGMMGVAAKDALVRIRDWEKILGKF